MTPPILATWWRPMVTTNLLASDSSRNPTLTTKTLQNTAVVANKRWVLEITAEDRILVWEGSILLVSR
jgi:hypothetical protein